MSGKDLSEAMGGIADEKIESAIHAYEKKGTRRNVWFRVAAVAAMLAIVLTVTLWPRRTASGEIITAPGIMKVYGYDWEENQDVAGQNELTVSALHAQALSLGITAVLSGTAALVVSEELNTNLQHGVTPPKLR